MQTGLGAVIFLTFCIIIVFSCGAFLVYRVMTKPGAHIGSRLPKGDPHDPENPDAEAAPARPRPPGSQHGSPHGQDSPGQDSPDPDDGEDPRPRR